MIEHTRANKQYKQRNQAVKEITGQLDRGWAVLTMA